MEEDNKKIILPKKIYDQIEQDAIDLHITLGLAIPVNPWEVVQKLGFVVNRYSESLLTKGEIFDLCYSKEGKLRDGLSLFNPDIGTHEIWINDIDSYNIKRNEFTIMHEIGHIRLKHKTDSMLAEIEANYYASYALVPSPVSYMYNCQTSTDIETIFGVSSKCARICIERCKKWNCYSGTIKPYEALLMSYYRDKGGIL